MARLIALVIGNPWVFIVIAGAFALSIGSAIWFKHEMDVAIEGRALAETRAGMWEGQARAATAELANVRKQLDSLDELAKAQQDLANRKVTELAKERDTALSRAEAFRTELERKANEPGATAASVGRAALEGLR